VAAQTVTIHPGNATFIICRPLRGLDEYFLPFSTGFTRGYDPSSPAGIKDTKTTIFLDDVRNRPLRPELLQKRHLAALMRRDAASTNWISF